MLGIRCFRASGIFTWRKFIELSDEAYHFIGVMAFLSMLVVFCHTVFSGNSCCFGVRHDQMMTKVNTNMQSRSRRDFEQTLWRT